MAPNSTKIIAELAFAKNIFHPTIKAQTFIMVKLKMAAISAVSSLVIDPILNLFPILPPLFPLTVHLKNLEEDFKKYGI